MSRQIEIEVRVGKGEGLRGLLGGIDWALMTSGLRIFPGDWVITLERKPGSSKRVPKKGVLF